jgi:hypothetical protein
LRPKQDTRGFEHIRLPNGLEALLISDSTADKVILCRDLSRPMDGQHSFLRLVEHGMSICLSRLLPRLRCTWVR